MKYLKLTIITVLLLFVVSNVFAQKRSPQIELFLGGAIPLGPELFKEAYQIGISGHGQYVLFPSPKLGISLGAAFEGFTVSSELKDLGIDGELTIVELGVGLRPYLTPMEASTQIFLFGMGTFTFLEAKFADDFGNEETAKEQKPGVVFGGGLELPAGARFNIILQAVTRVIFTEGDATSFLGLTAGLVF